MAHRNYHFIGIFGFSLALALSCGVGMAAQTVSAPADAPNSSFPWFGGYPKSWWLSADGKERLTFVEASIFAYNRAFLSAKNNVTIQFNGLFQAAKTDEERQSLRQIEATGLMTAPPQYRHDPPYYVNLISRVYRDPKSNWDVLSVLVCLADWLDRETLPTCPPIRSAAGLHQ